MDTRTLLGKRSPQAFLRRYWQREALLVRGAVPAFTGLFTRDALMRLAGRDAVESRLVLRNGRAYALRHGPFRRADWKSLPARNWTLLVQGVNLHDDAADALLRRFAFIAQARLDDVMVSYAVPGGGVGPHFDSYDVFLLQGFGRRRWRYGRQADLTLRSGLPVKILSRFSPEHDTVLSPGDMLYLPPQYAHDGTAIDACTTYSIGFRAPTYTEIAQHFLDFLRDRVTLDGRYRDRGAKVAREAARVPHAMQRDAAAQLAKVRWNAATVSRFLGAWLSEPKASVFFERPAAPLTQRAFAAAIASHGVRLDRRTQFLYDDECMYVNGEVREWPRSGASLLKGLANARSLCATKAASLPAGEIARLYADYRHGYLHPG
jgi:50S ribosomal protein L16 3-hydroxylase